MYERRDLQNLRFAGSPKVRLLLCKGGVVAIALLLPPAPVSKRMLLPPAPVSESLVSPLHYKKLALANWGSQQEHALTTCSTFSEQKMHFGRTGEVQIFIVSLCTHV